MVAVCIVVGVYLTPSGDGSEKRWPSAFVFFSDWSASSENKHSR